jgi:hypothetical protein
MSRHRLLLTILAAGTLAACQMPASKGGTSSGSEAAKGSGQQKEGLVGRILHSVKPEPVVLPDGTRLPVKLDRAVSSATSQTGDPVTARLTEDVRVADKLVLPAGTEVRGHVTAAVPSGRVKGRARLALRFESLVYKGKAIPVEIQTVDLTADNSHKRDAEIIGGGAGAGAIIGAIAGGGKGAGKGALIGAVAGTGAVLATKGQEVELPAGARWTLELTREARLG